MINKESLKKFVIETLVIISSILIAFSIDSYWDVYKQNQSRKSVISALEKDFEKTYDGLESSIKHKNSVVETMVKLILMPDAEVQTLEPSQLREMINYLSTIYTYIPPIASVDSLVSSGELNKINNHQLREALAFYRIDLQSLKSTQQWALDTINLRTIPFLAERIPMHLFSYNGPDVENNVQDLEREVTPNEVATYITPLFDELAFRNLAQNRLLAARITILKLKGLQESVAEVCAALKNENCSENHN
ncbi:DUF6090 family protein [Thalassotalea atypica]|uniref:DUF6090 family protein n=1 Tax=Thalassotalea atypica TaxID=2054316 RepID=UPI00257263E1|nr:DUF6090 family protein [Thalassotalea atypica]